MAEVRAGIDALDRQLVTLMAERLGYIAAAARIKPERGAVRDEWRKADVLAKVKAASEAQGVPPELTADLWERMVEFSIAHEFVLFDRKNS
ncbi:chorismate mutase [Sphingoaurantiacus capsulatus]|uniref:chorismate mutase n=1 Tax=Sphingoaurantiacus capsulatus TaxID=1771310 RepID=A0ABV7XCP9_9SPHN